MSAPRWNQALYGAAGAHQYDRLGLAIALDRTAALEAASWGMFQILGLNFARCGFAAIEDYVAAMVEAEVPQLAAFGEFCRRGGLDRFLRARDWTRFALGYNGSAEASNAYDRKLATAYRRRLAGGPPAAPQRPPPGATAPRPVPVRNPAPDPDGSIAVAEELNREELARLR